MEKDEKALLEELKFFDMNNLYQKGSYVDFNFQNYWFQAYINKVRPNNKYESLPLLFPVMNSSSFMRITQVINESNKNCVSILGVSNT